MSSSSKSKKFRNSIAMDVATSNRLSAIDAEMRQIQQAIQNENSQFIFKEYSSGRFSCGRRTHSHFRSKHKEFGAQAGSAAEGAARTHFGGCVPAVTLGDRQGRLEKKVVPLCSFYLLRPIL